MLPKNIYISASGGWGDLVRLYLKDEKFYGYIKGIKNKYPKTHIKVLLCIHNSEAKELFKHYPYIDECHNYIYQLESQPYFDKYEGDHVHAVKILSQIKEEIRWEKPSIYLNEKEEIKLKK